MNKSEEILNLLRYSKETKSVNDKFVVIGTINKKNIEFISKYTDENLTGYKRIIDVSAIRHTLKRHPDLCESDYCLIPLIVGNPDCVEKGKDENTFVYKRVFDDTFYYVEYVRKGRKYLAMKTFYKRKNRSK